MWWREDIVFFTLLNHLAYEAPFDLPKADVLTLLLSVDDDKTVAFKRTHARLHPCEVLMGEKALRLSASRPTAARPSPTSRPARRWSPAA